MMRLTVLREDRRWSRSELARRARMANSDVGKIEARRQVPYPSQLVKLTDALGFTGDPTALLDEVGGHAGD